MIELSRCDDFDLGSVHIRPSSREIISSGSVTVIEPKVMQLLVTLAAQAGRVVPREDVIEHCWQGRVVGEDAINRVIGKLRRAADEAAGGAFRVETVARVGLRLVVEDKLPTSPGAASAIVRSRGFRRYGIWGVAALLAIAGPLTLWTWRSGPIPKAPLQGATLPLAVSDLETRGLSAMFENTPERTAAGVAYLRQATAAAPGSAPTWGSLAMSYVLTLRWVRPAERAAVVARVRDAAAHAHAIDPRESRAAAALFSLVPTYGNWQAKEATLRRWEGRAYRDNGPLRYQRVQYLMSVGRNREALVILDELAKSSPLVPWIQAAHIDVLAANGRLEEADRAAAAALATWPRDSLIWFTSFDLAAFYGRPERAEAMAADHASWPEQTSAADVALAVQMVKAMQSGHAEDATAVVNTYKARSSLGQGHAERAMRAAAALGRLDDAMLFARKLYGGRLTAEPHSTMLPLVGLPTDGDPPTAALFLPPASALQRHRDYEKLLSTIGLAEN
jgi:DNA-binding winged helix-turn-helix (wHTH) protein/tetratricopeptide (TPR) repeat protein